MKICIECKGKIEADDAYDELPGHQFIHDDCADALLARPMIAEHEGKATRRSRDVGNMEW